MHPFHTLWKITCGVKQGLANLYQMFHFHAHNAHTYCRYKFPFLSGLRHLIQSTAYMYVCIYVRMYVCMYVCMFVCVCVYVYTANVCMRVYVFVYVCIYIYMYERTYVCLLMYCTYVFMYAGMYAGM